MTYVRIEPRWTRLGNWMFQYAAAKCAFPDDEVAFVIDGERGVDAVRRYSCLWPTVRYVREAPKGEPIRVGYFQDSKFVDRSMCRRLFMPALGRAAGPGLPMQGACVSIHVRRGDYMTLPHQHPFVGKRYFREAIARFPGAEFVVFSDDLAWCKKFFKGDRFHFAEGNGVLADLYLMTQCKGGHICSNSTFGWWGAYLGEGKTIFPSMWYGIEYRHKEWRGLYFEGSENVANGYTPGLWLKARGLLFKRACGDVLRKFGLR